MRPNKTQGLLFGISQSELIWFSLRAIFLIFSIQIEECIVNFSRKWLHRIYNVTILRQAGLAIKHKIVLASDAPYAKRRFVYRYY